MTHPTQEDDVKAIRDALALGSTPGPWRIGNSDGFAAIVRNDAGDIITPTGPRAADASHIAACNPARIARLLARLEQAERDKDAAVLAEREACAVACDSLYYAHIGPGFGEVRHGIAACAAAIRQRAAIASEAKP